MSEETTWKTPRAASHVAGVVRDWLGAPPTVVGEDLPDDLARLLLRVEESEHAHRGQWGCWEHGFSENFRRGRLWVPEIDLWVAVAACQGDPVGAAVAEWPLVRSLVDPCRVQGFPPVDRESARSGALSCV